MKNSKATRKSTRMMIILFLAPAVLLYCFWFIYPTIKAFYVSLFDWNGFTADMNFVGLDNFTELMGDTAFWTVAAKNSAIITFVGGLIIFALSFVICAVLSTKIRGKKFFRALIFFPAVVNPIAVSILWTFIYNNDWGLLNSFLSLIGLESWQQVWMDPSRLTWAILVALIWMYSGFYCVILLAALDRVPENHIEAATLEGASEFIIFFKIKLPMIWNVLATALTLWCINSIKEFALLYAWGGGIDIPPEGAINMAVRMYITAFGKRLPVYRMGYATAMGVVMFIAVALLVFIVSKVMKRDKLEY